MKKIIVFVMCILTTQVLARKIASCDEVNVNRPHTIKRNTAPDIGHYAKTAQYYVTTGRMDPYSEELLYFLLAKNNNLSISQQSYKNFHKYFKHQFDLLIDATEPGETIPEERTYQIVEKYFTDKGLLTKEKITAQSSAIKKVIPKIKKVLALKSNVSYYEIYPLDASVEIKEKGGLINLNIESNNSRLEAVIVTSELRYYKNREEEKLYNKSLVSQVKEELEYIEKFLPSKYTNRRGVVVQPSPIKYNIQEWLASL